MANKKNWLGMLAMVLVFGLIFISCTSDDENTCGSCKRYTDRTETCYEIDCNINSGGPNSCNCR